MQAQEMPYERQSPNSKRAASPSHVQQAKKKIKFRHARSGPRSFTFGRNQPWVSCANGGLIADSHLGSSAELRFVDSGATLRMHAPQPPQPGTPVDPRAELGEIDDFQTDVGEVLQGEFLDGELDLSPESGGLQASRTSSEFPHRGPLSVSWRTNDKAPQAESNSPKTLAPSPASSSRVSYEVDFGRVKPASRLQFPWPTAFAQKQCACLMRFFVEEIAPHADMGHPIRHFALEAYRRARECPPLCNAILTIAAMAMILSPKYKTEDGGYRYKGVSLPALDHQTVLQHHNSCITDLIESCTTHPAFFEDENLLAALCGLRTYEEKDVFYTGEDNEKLLHFSRILLNAQTETTMRTLREGEDGGTIPREKAMTYFNSFRHACFRVALRQELTAAYLKQRPVVFPLATWSLLEELEGMDAEDFLWGDRHLLHCARVLEFCYGMDQGREMSPRERWKKLKSYQRQWDETMPPSFQPLLQEPFSDKPGSVLYRVWYLSDLHLTSVQFFEISRSLLTVFDPTLPRLGPSAVIERQRISAEVRHSVLRICSIAASYPELAPAWVQASMAVVICGEYFTKVVEQDALLGIVKHLEEELGWPTSNNVVSLKETWGRAV